MKHYLFIALLIYIPFFLLAQKGQSGTKPLPATGTQVTHAMVISIFDYADSAITGLPCAPQDAQAFAEWLEYLAANEAV
ncbi:MAG: hypothetical protein KDD14_17805 [Saprospiraceae bacterium]|nr:hypothetical protein [Saprospiraceae bacterium]